MLRAPDSLHERAKDLGGLASFAKLHPLSSALYNRTSPMRLPLLGYITGLFTLGGIGYYAFCIVAARVFLKRDAEGEAKFAPGVSILKPVKGRDRESYEAFRSHCLQRYPGEYELIFGVGDLSDETVPLIEQLQRDFPECRIRLVTCPEKLGSNGKVSNLAQMARVARFDYLLVNDSDIRVAPDYLTNIMRRFAGRENGREIGMVTCPYRGIAGSTVWSRLEAIGISTEFFAGVLAAKQMEGGMRFGLGSTLATSRQALAAMGGYEALVDYLGDDYELGARIHGAGYAVVLSPEVVETVLPAYTFTGFLQHQLRWSRTTRGSRPWGHAGLLITFPVPWAVLTLLFFSGSPAAWALLAAALIFRWRAAEVVGGQVLHDPQAKGSVLLLAIRDFVSPAIWLAGFFGNTVTWRGETFHLKSGKLIKVRNRGPQALAR